MRGGQNHGKVVHAKCMDGGGRRAKAIIIMESQKEKEYHTQIKALWKYDVGLL